jgi:hypothetical protein
VPVVEAVGEMMVMEESVALEVMEAVVAQVERPVVVVAVDIITAPVVVVELEVQPLQEMHM